MKGSMPWKVRELAAEETHHLRRAVSADGRTDLPSMHHDLDDSPGAWHLGAVDQDGRILAISASISMRIRLGPRLNRRFSWLSWQSIQRSSARGWARL